MSREIRPSMEYSKAAQSEQVFRNSGLTTSIGKPKFWKRITVVPPLTCSPLGTLTSLLLKTLFLGSRCPWLSWPEPQQLITNEWKSADLRLSGLTFALFGSSLTAMASLQPKVLAQEQRAGESLWFSLWSLLLCIFYFDSLPCFSLKKIFFKPFISRQRLQGIKVFWSYWLVF